MTKRMSGLSMPMPNATVATTTSIAPARKMLLARYFETFASSTITGYA